MRDAHVAGSPCVRNGVRAIGVVLFALLCAGGITAQQVIPGNNVNMVSGTRFPTGDPFLQRQNEPSLAVSTRNPLHLLAGANDYRTVDLAGPFDPLRGDKMNADAWVGLFKSFDGGRTWQSTLLPGFPQDTSPEGLASPLKGRQAGTDPVVRAGTNGLFYYAGLGFDRGQNQPSTIFVARFIDLNNRENGDPIAYLGTHGVDSDGGVRFLDKPTLAIDVPRGAATCTISTPRDDGGTDTQTIGAGNVYVAYSSFTGTGTSQQSQILFSRSTDCGVTWSTPKNLSTGSILNQNAQIAINPANGHIWITWRRFKAGDLQSDGIFITRSIDGGATFSRPTRVAAVSPFDQGTTETSFRTNAFQTMAIDDAGRVYVAWPERGHAVLRPDRVSGDARIVVSTSTTGTTWTAPRAIETGGLGHQIMPTLSFHGGRLRLIYYDLREDVSQIFGAFIDELPILASPDPKPPRHTIDAYVAQALPSAQPVFTAARLSDYAFGTFGGSTEIQRLQYNPPNLPLFRQGTAPFMGDYIDLAPSPVFVLGSDGVWRFNTLPGGSAVSHGVWTDNRDVRAPLDGDWANYTPVMSDSLGVRSLFDPTQTVSPCAVGQTGMRNQNIYTAKVTEGLFVASPGNTKPLGSIQRGFVIIVENARTDLRSYRLQILNQPPGGQASFQQFSSTVTPLTVLDASVPPLSTIARTVYVTSSDPFAPVEVSVVEIAAPGAGAIPGGQASTIVLNADATNPSIQNPSIQNPSIQNPDIQVAEAYNPAITTAFLAPSIQNPSIQNPSIQNPSIQNPSIQNPELSNDAIANPAIINPSIQNPSIQNPSIQNPSIQNPSIQNRDLVSGSIQDTSWVVTNDGNTTASYAIKLLMNGALPDGFKSQLVLHKTYRVPSAQDCTLAQQPHTILLANIPDPAFAQVGDVSNPSIQNPSIQNATLSLAPGESANVTLRIVDPNRFDGIAFDAGAAIAPAAVAHSVNTEDAAQGITTPRVAIPLTITTAALTTGSPGGAYFASLQTFASTGTTSWTVTEGALPPGITLDPATGELSGTPTVPGNYVFTVRAVDANGNIDVQTLAIKIDPVVPDGFSRIWNGASNDWNDPRNWSPAGVPTTVDDVYISASIPVMPALTSDVTINSLVVESGATLDTNGFTLTLLGNGDGGNTIVGSGTVVMQGTGKTIRGTFPNLRVTGRITAIGPITATGHLTLAPGAALNLNGFASLVGGRLVTMAGGAIAPVIIGAGFGDGTTLTVGGLDVDGLSLDRVILVVNGGQLSGFDNVRFTNYQPDDVHMTLNHPGTAAPFAMSGLSFFVVPTSGRYIQATDTSDDANALVVNVSASLPGDGSSRSETQGGAIINWLFDPNDVSVGVSQSASPNPAVAGAPLTYTIVVANGGPAAATGVVVTNPLPASTSFVSVETQQGACGFSAGVVSCDLGSVLTGQVVVITMVVLPGTPGTLNNTVSVTASETDPATNDNSQGVTTQVAQAGVAADLSLTKADSTDPVASGVPFSYALAATNAGPGLATNVIVTDTVPAGVTPSAASATQGSCTIAGQTVTCQLGSLAAGASATVSITASATAFGIVTNTASVFAAEADPDPSNNVATETTVVGAESGCVAATFRGPELYEGPQGPATHVQLADMDGDGDLDLVTTHQGLAGGVSVLLNNGEGRFGTPILNILGVAAFVGEIADFNGDGHLDMAVGVGGTPNTIRMLLGNGTGTLTQSGSPIPVSNGFFVASLDADGDGDRDIITRGTTDDLILLRNDGTALFDAPVSLYATAVGTRAATGDFDGDGDTDIALARTDANVAVLLNDGNASFTATAVATTAAPRGIFALGDLNGDGHLDLGFTEGNPLLDTSRLLLRFGTGTGTFGPEVDVSPGTTGNVPTSADVNGDGHLDLVVNHSVRTAVSVQLGNGAGGFSTPGYFLTAAFSNPAVGDVNGDGKPDITTGDEDGTLAVLLNGCGSATTTDLGLTVVESADPVNENEEFVYTVTVTNHSDDAAANVVASTVIVTAVNSTAPPNATVTSTTTGPGGTLMVTESDGVHQWSFPSVAGNSSFVIEFRVRAHAGGTVRLTSGVTSDDADTNAPNNTAFELTTITAAGRDLVVTNTNDSGPGSLREAIRQSNLDTGDVDRIVFDIPGPGPHTIVPLTSLPTLTQPAVLDGTTQPGFAGTPAIELRGNGLAGSGLNIAAGSTTIRGLVVNSFGTNGISLFTNGGNVIEGNFVGVDVTGTVARPNGHAGIHIRSSSNVVGGTAPAASNVISGNAHSGVYIGLHETSLALVGNVVQGNRIGTNAAGTVAVANVFAGVTITSGPSGNTIGGTTAAARNVISGNGRGVHLVNGANGNTIVGNYIGVSLAGTSALANGSFGVEVINSSSTLIGGSAPGSRNVISGNGAAGVSLFGAADTLVLGNHIGVNEAGAVPIPNAGHGVAISSGATGNRIGGTAGGERNIISGNIGNGVDITGQTSTSNVIAGNYIGLGADGLTAIGNQANGVRVNAPSTTLGGASAGARNVIGSNGSRGVILDPDATGSVVRGNFFGTDLTGTLPRPNATGIGVHASNVVIGGTGTGEGNLISGNGGDGIALYATNAAFSLPPANSNQVLGNLIGTDVTGTQALPNTNQGIYVGGGNNVIGGTTAAARNVVSGNLVLGIGIASTADSNNNIVQGNFVGTNITGTAAIPNGGVGIGVHGASNTIGGTVSGSGNLIAGNAEAGIGLWDLNPTFNLPPATNTAVRGNLIGTNAAGTAALPNGREGIFIGGSNNVVGGATPAERNIISGNGTGATKFSGIAVGSGATNVIRGNYIGTDATGSMAIANGNHGITIYGGTGHAVGGTASGAGNLVSGNGANGIGLFNGVSQIVIQGNLIGTNATATAAIGNRFDGVGIVDSPNNVVGGVTPGARNVISGNGGNGVALFNGSTTGNVISGNYIGVNSAGTAGIGNATHGVWIANGATGNTIGGTAAGSGNVISGNTTGAVAFFSGSSANVLIGNLIGTSASGNAALGNGGSSVYVDGANNRIGGPTLAESNVIAATTQFSGIHIDPNGTGTIIQGNFIGTDRTATLDLSGVGDGIYVRGSNNTIGGPGAGNIIRFNGLNGIVLAEGTGNRISANVIFGNGLLGIELVPFGTSANDAGDGDTGANNLQNFPVLTSAVTSGGATTVQGTLNSTANRTFRIEFFANTACDTSGHGEGRTFAGFVDVTTGGDGNATFSTTVNGDGIFTATATDPNGNTSEFSACLSAGAVSADLTITKADSSDPVLINVPFSYTLTISNTGPSTASGVVVTDDLPAALSISSATSSVGSCSISGQLVTCNLGSVGPGESPTVTITAVPASAGLISNTASVSSDTADPTPGNNTATETTMVVLALACTAPTFSGPTAYAEAAGASSLVFLADMNHDGAPDIVTGHHTAGGSGAAVLLNDGTAVFGPRIPATSTNATVLPSAVADFNGDTHLDVLLIELIEQGNRLRLLLGDGTGALTPQTVFAVVSNTSFVATAADVDGDGDQDVLTRGTTGDLVVFRNGGTGVFATPASLLVAGPIEDSPVVTDFNGDNRADILISGPGAAFTVLLANASGGYEAPVTVPTASAPRVRGIGDVNGDGHMDIAITEGSSSQRTARLTLRFGEGTGAFGPEIDVLAGNTVGVTTSADINGDGHVDLISTHAPLNTVAVQLGDGSGAFAAPAHFSTPSFSNPAVADLDDDGLPDIVVGDVSGTLRVLLNACGQPATDLGLALVESADPIDEGEELVYTVTLTNHSASPATDITLTTVISNAASSVTLPSASVEATSSDGGTLNVAGAVFTWTLDSVAAQDDVTFVFRVTPHVARNLTFTSTVTSSGQDTDASNNTVSETTTVTTVGADLMVTSVNDSGPGSLRQAILNSNADSGDVDRIVFAIPGSGPHTISPVTSLPTIAQPVVIDGTTQPGFVGTPVIELNGNGLASNGLAITGGSSTVRGLAINRFSGSGINLATNGGNVVAGNFIGTDVTGTITRPNITGITVDTAGNTIGGTEAGSGNLVSGNTSTGIAINAAATNTQVIGNRIGTNIGGTAGLMTGSGIVVTGAAGTVIGGSTPAHRNLISGGGSNGILIQSGATNTRIEGNYIGTNALGTGPVGNGAGIRVDASSDNTIGGTAAGAGNVVSGNSTAILIQSGASGNLVQGNFVGTNASGTAALPNSIGIRLIASPGNTIGGTSAGARNVVSGNTNGVMIELSGASGNLVQGNFVGTTADGTAAIPNTSSGVWIRSNASGNTVGGAIAGARNVISGNNDGIRIADAGTTGNIIAGNFIGTDVSGTLDLGNAFDGITIGGAPNTVVGGTSANARNVISGNNSVGIRLSGSGATGTVIQGNYVGTNAAGTAPVGNSLGGISAASGATANTIGGTTAGAGNLISGNDASGLILSGVTNHVVQGNLIGTNASGTTALPNTFGVFVFGGGTHTIGGSSNGARNVISGNSAAGMQIDGGSSGNRVEGNHIGTNAAGTAPVANGAGINVNTSHGNTIGGLSAGAGNLISGNTGGNGIWINASNSNTVQGNRIGTNTDGSGAIPNRFGVFILGEGTVVGGTTAGAGNLISGNTNIGISVAAGATSTVLKGNLIGTDAAGTGALPNGSHGVFLDGANTMVGAMETGAANVIAYNGLAGVRVNTGTGHTILRNAIHNNTDIGIDVGPFGVTGNDAGDIDAGANGQQNFPVITSAVTAGDTTAVQGTLNSLPNTNFRIELFSNTTCDASGHGEGERFIGAANVMTNGDGLGIFSVLVGQASNVTATATDPQGSTSEFSACVATTAGTSSVTRITLAAFTGSEQVETYSPNFGRLTSPVTFNGITYTSPGGQLWSDIVWENNGFYTDWPTASRGTALNDLVGLTNLQIDFTTPVNRVGVFAATSPVTTFIMTAYDDNLVAIGSVSSTMPAAARAAFLGLEAGVNIRRIVITEPFDNGQISIFDDLRFEPVQGFAGTSLKGQPKKKKGGED